MTFSSDKNMKILAIGAHLDDIELACGGTLARAIKQGHQVKMIVMSQSGYKNYDGTVLRTDREAMEEGLAAARVLGVDDLEILDFDCKDIPYHYSVIEVLDKRISDFQPDVIFTHWAFDTHQAHVGVAKSSISAARYYNTILMFEPIAPSGRSYVPFRPQAYVDVSEVINTKIEALKMHKSQNEKYGEEWLGAVKARAKHRGYEMGRPYAECFEVLRCEMNL